MLARHTQEYRQYLDQLTDGYHGLEDPAVRDALRRVFRGASQPSLFEEPTLDGLLDVLLDEQLSGRQLYRRFQKSMKPTLQLAETRQLSFDTSQDKNQEFIENVLEQGEQHPKYREVKRSLEGKIRPIAVPSPVLRKFMDMYLMPFLDQLPVHQTAHGAQHGWTAERSVKTHLPLLSALTFDLESAFDNVLPEYVFSVYMDRLSGYDLGMAQRLSTAGWLTMTSTVKHGNTRCLPQGGPHSMTLFNTIWLPLDETIYRKAQDHGVRYSRWVDDVMLSSSDTLPPTGFVGVLDLVTPYFPVSPTKTFYQQGRIFALGHIIDDGDRVSKNTAAIRLRERAPALDVTRLREEGKIISWEN